MKKFLAATAVWVTFSSPVLSLADEPNAEIAVEDHREMPCEGRAIRMKDGSCATIEYSKKSKIDFTDAASINGEVAKPFSQTIALPPRPTFKCGNSISSLNAWKECNGEVPANTAPSPAQISDLPPTAAPAPVTVAADAPVKNVEAQVGAALRTETGTIGKGMGAFVEGQVGAHPIELGHHVYWANGEYEGSFLGAEIRPTIGGRFELMGMNLTDASSDPGALRRVDANANLGSAFFGHNNQKSGFATHGRLLQLGGRARFDRDTQTRIVAAHADAIELGATVRIPIGYERSGHFFLCGAIAAGMNMGSVHHGEQQSNIEVTVDSDVCAGFVTESGHRIKLGWSRELGSAANAKGESIIREKNVYDVSLRHGKAPNLEGYFGMEVRSLSGAVPSPQENNIGTIGARLTY